MNNMDEQGTHAVHNLNGELLTENRQLRQQLDQFRRLTPAEFRCLHIARNLPNGGVHAGTTRGPGSTEIAVLTTLEKRGLLERHPEKRLHWLLSEAGKLLLGDEVERE
jgi:hypothetical protein